MKVFVDTGPLLWLVEGSPEKAESVRAQLELWLDRGMELGAATQTLAELMVHPKALKDVTLQYRYRALVCELMSGPLLVLDDEAAELAAQFTGEHGLDFLTAAQLAIASVHGYDVFYTTQSIPAGLVECTIMACFGKDVTVPDEGKSGQGGEQIDIGSESTT